MCVMSLIASLSRISTRRCLAALPAYCKAVPHNENSSAWISCAERLMNKRTLSVPTSMLRFFKAISDFSTMGRSSSRPIPYFSIVSTNTPAEIISPLGSGVSPMLHRQIIARSCNRILAENMGWLYRPSELAWAVLHGPGFFCRPVTDLSRHPQSDSIFTHFLCAI